MKSIRSETLWTREFLGLSLSNFLIYVTQYAMIAALPIIIMTEYGGGDVEAGLAMTFFQIGTVAARPWAGILIDAVNKRRLMIGITASSSPCRRQRRRRLRHSSSRLHARERASDTLPSRQILRWSSAR